MTKEEKIKLLTDHTKTDLEISKVLNLSPHYIPILRARLGLKKKRGNKEGSKRTRFSKGCLKCGQVFETIPSQDASYCSRECMLRCDEYHQKLSCSDKSYMQTEAYKSKKQKSTTPLYRKYSNRVASLTRKVYNENVQQINPHNYPRTLAGVEGGYQLDHIIPVRYGFDHDLPPEEIAQVQNLRMLPWKVNLKKSNKVI